MTETPLKWRSSGISHRGTVREVNEDACLERPDTGLWIVADGMGGHEAGQVASKAIVDAFDDLPPPASRRGFVDEVTERLWRVNHALRELQPAEYDNRIIGSTVAVLIAFGQEAVCVWAGDSRIYRLRDGEIRQLTRDHSQVEELIAMGVLARERAAGHRMANVITRAVGADDELVLDVEPHGLEEGDVYLLCSDGLNKTVSDEEIGEVLASGGCDETVRALVHLSLVRGARDNVTAVVVEVFEAGDD